MKLHSFAGISLPGKGFNVTAAPEASYAGFQPSSGPLMVVEVEQSELERILASDFDPNTLAEDARAVSILNSKIYLMPLADCTKGATSVSWYGNAHALRALRQPSIGCQTVAFVATPSAIAVLQGR